MLLYRKDEDGTWVNLQTENIVDGGDLVILISELGLIAKEGVEFTVSIDTENESRRKENITKEKVFSEQVNGSPKQISMGCVMQFPFVSKFKFANGFEIEKEFIIDFHIPISRVQEFFEAQALSIDSKTK